MAEYVYPIREQSVHAKKLDPVLKDSCHKITGFLKPTLKDSLYLLAVTTLPDIRRKVASRKESSQQIEDPRHPLDSHTEVTK